MQALVRAWPPTWRKQVEDLIPKATLRRMPGMRRVSRVRPYVLRALVAQSAPTAKAVAW